MDQKPPVSSPWLAPGDTPWNTREFHVLDRHPLQSRVKILFAAEQIRRRQSHERQVRPVRAAADGPLVDDQAGTADDCLSDGTASTVACDSTDTAAGQRTLSFSAGVDF